MDKKTLNQYKSLQKEIPRIEKKLATLYKRKENIPEVCGKVQSSSKDFPYTEIRVSVQMDEPREADKINKQIRIYEMRLAKAEHDEAEIERFVAGIQDSTDRQIIELVYLEGKGLAEVGDILGYTKGRISQKIASILKD